MKYIGARDCNVRKIDKDTASCFLKDNHAQGNADFLVGYGLYYENELVQVLTFGKPRFNRYYSWELIRDCTKKDYIVQGGVSKLWKQFIDENTVRSCICYSYPHNEDLYTSKYVEHCNFTTINKAKPAKKVYFEGIWNNENKRIDKSILERQGVDRLLKGEFGHDRTNEQILLDLGFEKKIEDGLNPQVDSYFPEGIVYKITDTNTGKFYIGETFKKNDFLNEKYNGTGRKWFEYYEEFKDKHIFKREILKDDFKTPKELYDYEVKEIRKYCVKLENGKYQVDESTGCMNRKTVIQAELPVCPECNGVGFHHYKTCSQYTAPDVCEECGGKNNTHYKTCSQYIPSKACPECGSMSLHYKGCSKYVEPITCDECGGLQGKHLKTCSQYSQPTTSCSECGGLNNNHYKTCSQYTPPTPCEYCGSLTNHKKDCPNYKEIKCLECGSLANHHKEGCSHFNPDNKCSECGGIYKHKKGCSKYIEPSICDECGAKQGRHRKNCSKYVPARRTACPECGSITAHKKTCSKYRKKVCSECGHSTHLRTCSRFNSGKTCSECGGLRGRHRKGCSQYINIICGECHAEGGRHFKSCSKYSRSSNVCPECNGVGGQHRKDCSQYSANKVCEFCGKVGKARHKPECPLYTEVEPCKECGGKNGHHIATCSKYRKNKACTECGSTAGHKDFCSKSKGKCPECGYSIQSYRHAPTCSQYKEPKKRSRCPECGSGSVHKNTCSGYSLRAN